MNEQNKQTGKRKNIPEVGLVNSATDRVEGKKKYVFDPYLDPQLQWSGKVEKNELEIDTVSHSSDVGENHQSILILNLRIVGTKFHY